MTQLTSPLLSPSSPSSPSGATAFPTDFDRTTSLTQVSDRLDDGAHHFAVDLDPGWLSLVGIHGGYMCAIVVRGAESLAPDRRVRTVTTSFLRNGAPGPAVLSVRDVRSGRSMTTMVGELRQDDRLLLVSRVTLLTDRTGVEWRMPRPPTVPPFGRCEPIPIEKGTHFERAEGRLDPDHLPFTAGDTAMVRGYLRPLEHRTIDSSWLAMATDWFPPPSFVRLDPPTGGVSIDLTTHVHRPELVLGDDEWLIGRFEVENSTGGLAVEHGTIVTIDGTPVAESFQTRLTAQD